MAIGTGYDDNLYAVNAPRIGDAYFHIVPRLKIVRPSPNLKLTLNGEFDLTRYASRISENQTNYRLDGGAHYVISNETTVDLTGLYGRFAQERTEPDSPALVQRPIRFTISEASGAVTHGWQAPSTAAVDNTVHSLRAASPSPWHNSTFLALPQIEAGTGAGQSRP